MFKSGGYNIYPREIELALARHPGVAMAAVVAVPDDLYGEVGRAYVSRAGTDPLSVAELDNHCRARLSNYKFDAAHWQNRQEEAAKTSAERARWQTVMLHPVNRRRATHGSAG